MEEVQRGNAIDFYVCDSTADNTPNSGVVHTMSLDYGKVGIGTTTPARLLHLKGTDPAIKLTDGSNNAYITYDDNNIRFHVSAAGADTEPTSSNTETNEVLRLRGGMKTTHVLYGLQVGLAYNNTYTGWGSYDQATLKIPFYCTKTTSVHGTYTTWMNNHNYYVIYGYGAWNSWINYSGTSTLRGNIPAVAIFAGSIQVSGNIHMYSDRRIKKEIVDADDDSCLNIIRQIQNRKYKYIDPFSEKESNNEVYGFIAQEVESIIIPEAVGRSIQYIPNIMMEGDVVAHSTNSNQYYITTSSDFTIENTLEGKVFIKSYEINLEQDIIHTLKFISQESTNSILVETNEEIPSRLFLYGEYVYDFRTLDKNKIYTISVGALQEIDRQQQSDKAEIADLKTKVATLETNYNNLLARIQALESN